MTDPLSIISAAINVAAVVVQSSTAICEIVSNIRAASEDIKLVARDVQALYPLVSKLCTFLKDKEIRSLVSQDESLLEMVGNLKNPLENCRYVLGRIMVKLERLPHRRSNAGRVNDVCSSSIKWVLFDRNELRDLHVSLEAMKATLHLALTALST